MSEVNRFWPLSAVNPDRVTHRELGDIPGITEAVDVFSFNDEGYLVLKNPSKPMKVNYYAG